MAAERFQVLLGRLAGLGLNGEQSTALATVFVEFEKEMKDEIDKSRHAEGIGGRAGPPKFPRMN